MQNYKLEKEDKDKSDWIRKETVVAQKCASICMDVGIEEMCDKSKTEYLAHRPVVQVDPVKNNPAGQFNSVCS